MSKSCDCGGLGARSRWLAVGGLHCLILAGLVGCGPALTPEDLGSVELKVPKLPGTEIPYSMPELESPSQPSNEAQPGHSQPPAK